MLYELGGFSCVDSCGRFGGWGGGVRMVVLW